MGSDEGAGNTPLCHWIDRAAPRRLARQRPGVFGAVTKAQASSICNATHSRKRARGGVKGRPARANVGSNLHVARDSSRWNALRLSRARSPSRGGEQTRGSAFRAVTSGAPPLRACEGRHEAHERARGGAARYGTLLRSSARGARVFFRLTAAHRGACLLGRKTRGSLGGVRETGAAR